MRNIKYKYEFEILDKIFTLGAGQSDDINGDIVKVKRYKKVSEEYQILYIQINGTPETFLERGYRTSKENGKFTPKYHEDFKRFEYDNYCDAFPNGIKRKEVY